MSSTPLYPLETLLKIECAGGEYLPYTGFIEVDVTMEGVKSEVSQCVPFLVVPKTAYSEDVLVLLGTNVLRPLMQKCRERYGPSFLQKKVTATPWWLAFRAMCLQERQGE